MGGGGCRSMSTLHREMSVKHGSACSVGMHFLADLTRSKYCRYVMDDAREDALVLLDELGKGTEVAAGTALAAAFLERLAGARCRGIFAT